jgi:hypothetical protein
MEKGREEEDEQRKKQTIEEKRADRPVTAFHQNHVRKGRHRRGWVW